MHHFTVINSYVNTFTRHNLVTLSLEIPNARPFLLTTCSCWELSEIQQTMKHGSRIHAVLLGNSSCYVWSLAVKILHTCRFFPILGLKLALLLCMQYVWYIIDIESSTVHTLHVEMCMSNWTCLTLIEKAISFQQPSFHTEDNFICYLVCSYEGRQKHAILL